jgi:hypothetical protein
VVRDPWHWDSQAGEDPDLQPEEPRLPEGPFGWRIDLHAALAALVPDERALVVFRVLHGLDYAELSREMGVAESALRMRYARALEKLRAGLADEPRAVVSRGHALRDAAPFTDELRSAVSRLRRAPSLREELARVYFDESARLVDANALRERLASP